jgi:hypothetical protein
VGATSIFWSPDAEELVYGLSRIGGSGLGYVEKLSLKTGERLRLHDESAVFLVPNLLPGGNVVLSRNRDELELLQPDGSPLAHVQFSGSGNWPGPGYATRDGKDNWLLGSFGKEAPILYGEPKAMNQVATGVSPALAPRADWIAYFASDTIRLVRQDATQDHQLVDIGPLGGRERHFAVTPDCYPDRLSGCSYRSPLLSWTASVSHDRISAAAGPVDTAPDWSSARVVARAGRILTVRLDASSEVMRVDLSQLGVFDCRIDCFMGIGDLLGGVNAEDQLCFGWLGIRDGRQNGKLSVNRYTCHAGGRVIPP